MYSQTVGVAMKFIDAEQINRALSYAELISGLDRYHRQDTPAMEDMLIAQPIEDQVVNHLLVRAAWQYSQAVGIKLVTIFPDNPSQKSLPAVQALYVVFDGADGSPIATIDGAALTYWKTAADSALGARYLARKDIANMLMVGAGAMAPHLIKAHCAASPSINRVSIWNRNSNKAKHLAAELNSDSVSVQHTEDLETSARQADLISSATMAKEPLIRGTWLSPGTHLDLVGAFTPDMREADDAVMKASTVFVDARQTTIGVVGEIMIPLSNGPITEADIVADLFDLCRGDHHGRTDREEVTLYKNGGGGHLDLMTARLLLEALDSHP